MKLMSLVESSGLIRSVPSTVIYPLYWLANRFSIKNRSVLILGYHRVNPRARDSVTPAAFEQQVSWLKKTGYHFVSIKEYFNERDHAYFWKRKNVVITFDDGYEDNYLYAFPILKRYNAKCTIFVTTSCVNKNSILPWYNSEPRASEDFRMLSWKQIGDMSKYGIEFGSHTVTHSDVTCLGEFELRRELMESQQSIEDHIGQSVAFLSYPFGRYNKRVVTMASEVGYHGACSSRHGLNGKNIPDYELKRVFASVKLQTLFEFQKKIIGAYDLTMFIYELFSNRITMWLK